MSDDRPVLTGKRDRTFWITINRPERNNAMNDHVTGGIADALRAAQSDEELRAVVLTGAGEKTFCAGGELSPQPHGSPFKTESATWCSSLRTFSSS